LRHEIEDAQHWFALTHDVLEVVALLEGALELDVLFFRAVPGDGRAHVSQELLIVPWFLDEVGGARLHRGDRLLHRTVRRNHDDRQLRMVCANLARVLLADAVGHRESQTSALSLTLSRRRFRGEEWIIDALDMFLWNSGSCI